MRRDSLINTTPTTAVARTNNPANGLTCSRKAASSATPPAARLARMIVNSPRATRDEPTLTLCAAGEARRPARQDTRRPAYRPPRSARRRPARAPSLSRVSLRSTSSPNAKKKIAAAKSRSPSSCCSIWSRISEPESRMPARSAPTASESPRPPPARRRRSRSREPPAGAARGRASARCGRSRGAPSGRPAGTPRTKPRASAGGGRDLEPAHRRRPRPGPPRRRGRARWRGPRTPGCRAPGPSRRRPAAAGRRARA